MKKKLLFLAAMLGFALLLLPVQSNAANPKVVKLEEGKAYKKYDVTGNGTVDTFKYVVDESTGYTSLYLNGTKRNEIFTYRYPSIKLISFDSKNVFLAVNSSLYNGSALDFYKYSNGKFKNAYSENNLYKDISYIGYRYADVKKVSGKMLYIKENLGNKGDIKDIATFKKSTKAISWDMKYTVKSGKLVLASRTALVNNPPTFTALTTFKTSTTAPTNKYNSFTVKKGDKVKLTKIYFPSGGKTAWFKVEKGSKWGWFQSSSKRLLK